ncbi:MAG: hypothetical protein KY441_07485, partial [Actinobacteria bacterium]|nr:hypothetical protein [Actinomycetota bacterium]
MPVNEPLSDDAVNTQEQVNQDWTSQSDSDERRGDRNESEPLRAEQKPVEPLDNPAEGKLEEVMANPHSDAQDTTDTQGEPGPL